jgi:hypothetical protein
MKAHRGSEEYDHKLLTSALSGYIHAPAALTRVIIEQKAWLVPSQFKRCGSRISTTSAEL